MDKIGFVGSYYDKTDFIVQIAKFLTVLGKRVIVIDTSLMQKTKYIIPAINPTKTYVTTFEEIDVAVGFDRPDQISNYLGIENLTLGYDVALIDVDGVKAFDVFDLYTAKNNYFVTSYDFFSLKRGMEVLANLKTETEFKKVIFSRVKSKEENEYMNFLSLTYKVLWDKEIIYFPYENGDQSVIMENQRVAKVKFKGLSDEYKVSVMQLVSEISGNTDMNFLMKTLKNIEKGV